MKGIVMKLLILLALCSSAYAEPISIAVTAMRLPECQLPKFPIVEMLWASASKEEQAESTASTQRLIKERGLDFVCAYARKSADEMPTR